MQDRNAIALQYSASLAHLRTHTPPDPEKYHLRITSGTTGTPVITLQQWAPFWSTRYGKSTVILSCYGQRSLRLFQALTARDHKGSCPARILCLDHEDISPALTSLISDFAPDRIQGHVSFIARALAFVLNIPTVKIMCAVGERISEVTEHFFRERLPAAHIALDYISIETGALGRSCVHQPLNSYHPEKGVQISIETPGSDGIGTILASRTYNGIQFDRYNTGDAGRVIPGQCTCGNDFTFEHLGRAGFDHIKLRGTLIRQDEFDRVLKRYVHVVDDYRIDAKEVTHSNRIMGSLTLRIYSSGAPPSEALITEMSEDISRRIYLTPTLTFADLVARNIFTSLTILYVTTPFREKNKLHRFSAT